MSERYFSSEEVAHQFLHGNQVGYGETRKYEGVAIEEQTLIVLVDGELYPLTANFDLEYEEFNFKEQTVNSVIQKTRPVIHTYWEDSDGLVIESEIVYNLRQE